jgi:hypothetical protein
MKLNIESVSGPGDWALNISKTINASEYINPPGGIEILDQGAFKAANINLTFLRTNLTNYKQGGRPFEPGLSIIDVMMFNSPDTIREMLDEYDLL